MCHILPFARIVAEICSIMVGTPVDQAGCCEEPFKNSCRNAVRAANLDGADFSGDQHLADILTGRVQIRCKRCNGQNVGKIVKSSGIGNSDLGFHDNNLLFLA